MGKITYKEADKIYRLDALKAEEQYNEECSMAYRKKEAALTMAARKRMDTKTLPRIIK